MDPRRAGHPVAGVTAQDISMRYGDRTVLDAVSFALPPGTLTVLSGRSGSGKSTLMSVLAGLRRPTTGHVTVGGERLDGMDEEARTRFRLSHIGLVFQDFRLIPDLTVEENVRLPMTLAGKKEARAAALHLLETVGMKERAGDFPDTLSGGEAQRTAVARALANKPQVVLADEPTANLDEPNATNVLSLLQSIARSGRTVVVASHDPLALPFADAELALREGRLVRERRGQGPFPQASQAPA